MSKHTPGPWEYRKQFYAYEEPAIFSGGALVCSFGHEYESSGNLDDGGPCEPYAGTPPRDEDARLIAAAPDLLEALRWAEKALRLGGFGVDCEMAAVGAGAAIAKATGERGEEI